MMGQGVADLGRHFESHVWWLLAPIDYTMVEALITMQHHVVIIHGMGEGARSTGYSLPLQKLIAKHMGDAAASLRYHEVNWSDIGQAEEDQLLAQNILPNQWHPFEVLQLGDSLLEVVDRVWGLSTQFRRFLINSIGDVFTYLTLSGKQAIQARVKEKIFEARAAQIEAGIAAPHYVTVLAHSLGSVVIYDLARYFGETEEGRTEVGTAALANLVTFGSPLALFSLLEYGQHNALSGRESQQNLLSDGQSGQQDPHPYSRRGIRLDLAEGAWLNFYDQQDAIACTLHDLYTPQNDVCDRPVQTGSLHAHTRYWENDDMAREIAGQLQLTFAALEAKRCSSPH